MSKKNGQGQIKLIGANNTPLERIQTYGSFDTASYQTLDGTVASASSTALLAGLYRLKAFVADSWISIGQGAQTAVDQEGMLMTQYDELILEVADNDIIAVIGGQINIVPLV